MGRRFLAVTAAAGLLAFTAACGGGEARTRRISAARVGSGAGFSPPTVTVDKGDRLTLLAGNTTTAAHGFSIEGYGVRKEVAPGAEPLKVELTASKAGVYKIYCQLHPAHRTATLVVR